jgi:anti-sigma regulatory factor (Ser/Thr protein kinase)
MECRLILRQPQKPTCAAAIEDRKIGGIGLHLINQLMSRVFYKRVKNKNVLVLNNNKYA